MRQPIEQTFSNILADEIVEEIDDEIIRELLAMNGIEKHKFVPNPDKMRFKF